MNTENKDEVVYLHLDDIIPNRFQPREVFEERALKELAVSIKEHGVIQPIIVRSVNGKYEIIAGERRYKASALAGLTKIPAIIRNLDDKESSKVALLENLQRRNLNPIEEARTCQKILELDQLTQEELAKTLGKSQSAIANKLRLLSLPDDIQDALLKEQISERHARALLNVPDIKKQKDLLKKIINNKMSVRMLEEEINAMNPNKNEGETNNMNNDLNQINPNFINTNPLQPTTQPEEESTYGKVTVAPPPGMESTPYKPKFINYGEVNNDEEPRDIEPSDIPAPVNVDSIRESSRDIIPQSNNQSSSLDNLLNINSPISNVPYSSDSNNNKAIDPSKFITPAEAIVKSDAIKDPTPEEKDYFQTPDFKSMGLPLDLNLGISSNLVTPKSIEKYDLPKASEKIKELVSEIRESGLQIQLDEMDFEKSHQIIIKIDKDL